MIIVRSTVQFFDCSLIGGDGPDRSGPTVVAQEGGAGLVARESEIHLSGCTIEGGPGGLDVGNLCFGNHAPGGAGLKFLGTPSTIQAQATTATGGQAALGVLCGSIRAPAGPPIFGAGTIQAVPGYDRHLWSNGLLRGGDVLQLDVQGQPGDTPLVLVSTSHAPVPLPTMSGVLLLGPLEDVFLLADLPSSGRSGLSFAVPSPGSLVGAVTYYAQALFFDDGSRLWLGSGASIVLVDGPLAPAPQAAAAQSTLLSEERAQ